MYWIKYSASTHFGFNRQFIVNDSFVRGTIKHTTGHACRFSCLTVYDFSTEAPPTLCFTVLLSQIHWYVINRNDLNTVNNWGWRVSKYMNKVGCLDPSRLLPLSDCDN